jgi:hypothetical protein
VRSVRHAPPYLLEDTGKILQNLLVPEAHNAAPMAGDLLGSRQIGLLLRRVLTAIDLNREPGRGTGEINDVPADRMLPAKARLRK